MPAAISTAATITPEIAGQRNSAQIVEGTATPRDQRSYPREQQQAQADRNIHSIEEGFVYADLFIGEGFRENRKQRAPEHRKAARKQ